MAKKNGKSAKNGKNKKPTAKTAKKPLKKAAKKPAAKLAAKKPVKSAKPAKKAAPKKAVKPIKAALKKIVKALKPAKAAPKKVAAKKTEKPPKALKAKPVRERAPAKENKGRVASEGVKAELEAAPEEEEQEEEVVLTDAEGRRYCRVKDCDQLSAVDGYCRYHYLLFWKKIQIRKKILSEGKLERYIEELTARYPDKFLDLLRKDLKSEKEFLSAIQELEIDESAVDNEFEDEAQNYIDEVRGMGETAGGREEEDF